MPGVKNHGSIQCPCPDAVQFPFETHQIADLEPAPSETLPAFTESRWLRLDGKY